MPLTYSAVVEHLGTYQDNHGNAISVDRHTPDRVTVHRHHDGVVVTATGREAKEIGKLTERLNSGDYALVAYLVIDTQAIHPALKDAGFIGVGLISTGKPPAFDSATS